MNKRAFFKLAILGLMLLPSLLMAQTTEFSYQGKLNDGANPANASYDFEYLLFDAASGGTQIGSTLSRTVAVAGGIFTVNLDFGAGFPGGDRYLEIRVRLAGGVSFTTLTPRQRVASSPYSIKSIEATTAATATNATQLGGVAADQYVQTTDARLTDPRSPSAGSANYVQNTTIPQPTSNFNISGTGNAGILSAATEYRLGGERTIATGSNSLFLGGNAGQNSTASNTLFIGRFAGQDNTGSGNIFIGDRSGRLNTGSDNTFAGSGSGTNNTAGGANSFFGHFAGLTNTTGAFNAFFGEGAGQVNNANSNSFFGYNAGRFVSTGANNVFVGSAAGAANTTGSNNTLLGQATNLGSSGLMFASAVGSGAVVSTSNSVVLGRNSDTVQIPGNLTVTGALTASINGASITNLNALNIATGTLDNARLGIVPVGNGGTGVAASGTAGNFLRSNGSAWTSSTIQASDISSLGSSFVQNTTVAQPASNFNISGVGKADAFDAIQYRYLGSRILGQNIDSVWVGTGTGTLGAGNTLVGRDAGEILTAGGNSLIGRSSGKRITSGSGNSFVGNQSGLNTAGGSGNTIIGSNAGGVNISGNNNTVLGEQAEMGSSGLSYATAIGSDSVVGTSNTITLGRSNGADTVRIPGRLALLDLASGGSTPLCRSNLITGPQVSDCSSSLRYKTNIIHFGLGLDLIRRLEPITFNWKEGGMHDLGLGAEDVAAVEPLLVTYKNGQVEGVKYDRIGVVLINAVKEQQAQIERQHQQIEDLKARLLALEGAGTKRKAVTVRK